MLISLSRPIAQRFATSLVGALFAMPFANVALTAPAALTLAVEPGEQVLFDHSRDACEVWDVPDTPIRAYRDEQGLINIFQTHFRNRRTVGKDVESLKHLCDVVFQGKESKNPADFDDRGWIASTYTLDGKTVYGIVHNEFQAHRWADLCPSRTYAKCWYNTLTAVQSSDGGATFVPAEPRRLIAAIPFRADQTQGGHAGYFEPTNVVSQDGAYYFMANMVGPAPLNPGNCLFQTRTLEEPSSWRIWRRGSFTTAVPDPYVTNVSPADFLCDPIAKSALPWPVKSLVRHKGSGLWIATMLGGQNRPDRTRLTGIYYSTSKDLMNWQGPTLLLQAPTQKRDCGADHAIAYPAIIDFDSDSRNFETVSDDAELTFVKIALADCRTTTNRNIVSTKIRISSAGAAVAQ